MKKVFKTALSIFMGTIFFALTLFPATATLPIEIKAQVDAFYQHRRQLTLQRPLNIEGLREWNLRVVDYIRVIGSTSPGKNLVPEILLYLASRIGGNRELQSMEFIYYHISYCPNEGIAGSIIVRFITPLEQLKQIII